MAKMGDRGVEDHAEGVAQIAADLRLLLERADAIGLTLVSIHIENALNECEAIDP